MVDCFSWDIVISLSLKEEAIAFEELGDVLLLECAMLARP